MHECFQHSQRHLWALVQTAQSRQYPWEEKLFETRRSILGVTHQMGHKKIQWMNNRVVRVGTWIDIILSIRILLYLPCSVWYWRYWLVLGGSGTVWGGTGWNMVVLGQYNSVLLSIELHWVSKVLVCLRFGRVLPMPDISLTHRQQNIELLSLYQV